MLFKNPSDSSNNFWLLSKYLFCCHIILKTHKVDISQAQLEPQNVVLGSGLEIKKVKKNQN